LTDSNSRKHTTSFGRNVWLFIYKKKRRRHPASRLSPASKLVAASRRTRIPSLPSHANPAKTHNRALPSHANPAKTHNRANPTQAPLETRTSVNTCRALRLSNTTQKLSSRKGLSTSSPVLYSMIRANCCSIPEIWSLSAGLGTAEEVERPFLDTRLALITPPALDNNPSCASVVPLVREQMKPTVRASINLLHSVA